MELYEYLAELDPEAARPAMALADVLLAEGRRGDAIAEIDAVLAEHPQFVMGHLFKAAWLTQAILVSPVQK